VEHLDRLFRRQGQDAELHREIYTYEAAAQGALHHGLGMAVAKAEIGSGSRSCLDERRYGSGTSGESDVDDVDLDGLLGYGYDQSWNLGDSLEYFGCGLELERGNSCCEFYHSRKQVRVLLMDIDRGGNILRSNSYGSEWCNWC